MDKKLKVAFWGISAALAAVSLTAAIMNPETAKGFLVFASLCVGAIVVFYLYNPAVNPKVDVDVSTDPNRARLTITPTEIGRPEWTPTAIAPTIRRVSTGSDVAPSADETATLERFATLLQQGDATDYAAATTFLERNEKTLRRSWKLQVNYGNCLIMQGRYNEAREVAESVLHNFGSVPQAEARARGLLILYLDSRTPNTRGKLRDEILHQQLRHVELGLQADPTFVELYLNEFEVRCEQEDLENALVALRKAAMVDQEAATRGIQRALNEEDELRQVLTEDPQLRGFLSSLGIDLGGNGDADE